MEVLDIIILIVLGLFVVLGFRKGLIISLATLTALALGVFLAIRFSDRVGGWLTAWFTLSGNWVPVLSYSVTFLGVLLVVLLVGKLLEKVIDTVGLGFLNHMAGALFGLLKGVLILSLVFWIIGMLDPDGSLIPSKAREHSLFYPYVQPVVPWLAGQTDDLPVLKDLQEGI